MCSIGQSVCFLSKPSLHNLSNLRFRPNPSLHIFSNLHVRPKLSPYILSNLRFHPKTSPHVFSNLRFRPKPSLYNLSNLRFRPKLSQQIPASPRLTTYSPQSTASRHRTCIQHPHFPPANRIPTALIQRSYTLIPIF